MVASKKIKREVVKALKEEDWVNLLVERCKPVRRVNPQKSVEPYAEHKIQPLRAVQSRRRNAKKRAR